jgi:Tfp pilus assembly protein PilO
MKAFSREKKTAFTVLILLITVIFYLTFIRPMEHKISVNELQIARWRQKQAQALSSTGNGGKEMDAWQNRNTELSNRLPDAKDNAQMLAYLAQLALKNNLRLDQVRENSGTKWEMPVYTLTCTVQGLYPSIKAFLAQTESSPRLLAISGLEITPVPEENSDGNQSGDMEPGAGNRLPVLNDDTGAAATIEMAFFLAPKTTRPLQPGEASGF